MRKLVSIAALVLVLAGFGGAARAQFCPGVSPWVFDDVQASDPFCGFITWMAQNNVTLGCSAIDANHRLYCPDDFVTRKQMAAFMNRTANAVMPLTCATGQVMKWNGAVWACANDDTAGGGGGGGITSLSQGTGIALSPNPITTTGTINLAPTHQLPQSCTNGQVPKSNGAGGWTCGSDSTGTGTVTSIATGTGLTGGPITSSGTIAVNTNAIQARVTGSCPAGSYVRAIAADGTVTCQSDNTGPANALVQGGNAFGTMVALGTIDNQAVAIKINGVESVRISPTGFAPNVVVGNNSCDAFTPRLPTVGTGVRGAVIAGGGAPSGGVDGCGSGDYHKIWDNNGTISGGYGNTTGNANADLADAAFATVSGGVFNTAAAYAATVSGGDANQATWSYAVVSGGNGNVASAVAAAIPGGRLNVANGFASLAAGYRAKANAGGSMAFSDSTEADLVNSAANSFIVGFTGGIGMWTNKAKTTGCQIVGGGGAWICTSSRDEKKDFADVDAQAILDRVLGLAITEWRYRDEVSGARHLGPMAQDFHAAFGLGPDERSIGVLDASGVALAAIQGLNAKLETQLAERDAEIAAQRAEIDRLRAGVARIGELEAQVAALRSTPADVAAIRVALAELLRDRSGGVVRTRLAP